ncbi:hypothetical protein [Phenylobacterium sp.]|uniref:hypothetical protein n=1 Tax=Phenylobacterium sp. TaxID=1871053 RepID=UPI00276350E4|nr:hypothetical protein [Phenylobacterium sp.]
MARRAGLSISMWVGAVVRAKVWARPTLGAPNDIVLADALTELRRIAIALTHIAQHPQPAEGDMYGRIEVFAIEVRAAVRSLRRVLNGNLEELRHDDS